MANEDIDKLETFSVAQLLRELRAREKAKSLEAPGVVQLSETLRNFDTSLITQVVKNKQKVIYGVDDRQDLFEVSDSTILNSADSVVSLWPASAVEDNGDGTSTLRTQTFGRRMNLCNGERFRNQPVGAFCSGFLVAPEVIATAGHCVNGDITGTRFIFGFRMVDANTAQTTIDNNEIYRGVAVIGLELADNGADWALVLIDRPVRNHRIASIRRTGTIADDEAVYVIGHPSGLPIKFAPGANVRDNDPAAFFVANLDTYGGNSGSPVFNGDTHQVEGILVRGETDFVSNNGCNVSLVCPSTGCRGEDCTRTAQLASPVLAAQGKVTFLRVHDVGTAFGPPHDQLNGEVIIKLDSDPGRAFGFQLRNDPQEGTHRGMLDLLRDAFNNDRAVRIDYEWSGSGSLNGRILRVAKIF